MHMYIARKNVPENREITAILKGEMSFATETRLAPQLDQGLASTQVWDQALALPPLQGGMSRFRCVQLLSALLI